MGLPYSTHDDPYTDTSTTLGTAADLRRLLEGVPDDAPVYFFGYAGYDTMYGLEAEYKTQQCIEHSGRVHEKTGVIFQVQG